MRTKANVGGRAIEAEDVLQKPPAALVVPIREIDVKRGESLALGFRQSMCKIGKGRDGGEVLTGTGLGTDYIILKWRDREFLLRGSELLRACVKTIDTEDAARFPSEIAEAPSIERKK